jgi:dTDP-4-amino-4,6-dideoxygalactose transaminase
MFSRLDALNSVRRQNADALRKALSELPGLQFVSISANTEPVYTRLPIFISNPEQRSEVLRRLNRRGVVASVSYPQAISDVTELRDHLTPGSTEIPGARQVAREIITLPTHPYVTTEDVALIRDTLNEVLA